jgi:hypothetical protein
MGLQVDVLGEKGGDDVHRSYEGQAGWGWRVLRAPIRGSR